MPMKIAVCVKQVPDTEARLRVRKDGKWIEEEDLPFVLNESDGYALEAGSRINAAKDRLEAALAERRDALARAQLDWQQALGAYHALVPMSLTTSPPPALARSTQAWIFSGGSRSLTGIPLTLVRRGSGTMSSPWPPSKRPWISSTLTPSSHARNVL